jgi:hypothetical protein
MKSLDKNFLPYIAGLIDGEGYIGIIKDHETTLRVRFSITNINKEVLQKIRNFFGYGFVTLGKKAYHNDRENYQFRVCNHLDLERTLKQVYPYLLIKKKQASLMLEYLNLRKSPFVKIVSRNKRGIIKKVCSTRSDREFEIYEEMKKLNAKGRILR